MTSNLGFYTQPNYQLHKIKLFLDMQDIKNLLSGYIFKEFTRVALLIRGISQQN